MMRLSDEVTTKHFEKKKVKNFFFFFEVVVSVVCDFVAEKRKSEIERTLICKNKLSIVVVVVVS